MKTLLVALLLVTSSVVTAATYEREFRVQARTDKNRPVLRNVTLVDLTSPDSFDGEHFKIVRGKSNDAIGFDAPEELVFKAATVYHHLTIARNYFVHHVKSDYVSTIPKMTIRLELTNQFSELGHFAHDNLEPQFNNALTIPAGVGLASRGVRPWGMEIWFRPKKKVHLNDIQVNDFAAREFKGLMNQFRQQMHMQTIQRYLSQIVVAAVNSGSNMNPFSMDSVIRTVGSSVMLEAGFLTVDPITRLSTRKWYWLDTALVPEIIYHEYAHAALSDHLVLSHSTAIIEGMADFFAGQIAKSPKLAMKIKQHNTFNGKNAKRKQQYMLQFEMGDYANTDFVFGLLWQLKSIVGEEKGEAFMFELRRKITTNSSIRGQLIEGILQTCDEMCDNPFVDKLRILKALNLRGI
jgi:hypothetical protein